MDAVAIIGLVEKGLTVASMLIDAGKSAGPAVKALLPLVTSAQTGQVTEAQIAETEAILDAQMAEFNEPL